MLYLDYSRNDGEWTPKRYGGRENLEAVSFLQEMNATVYKRASWRHDGRRGVDRMAGSSGRPTAGGLGFGFKWNMGWMHDTLDYLGHEPVLPALPPRGDHILVDYACTENFVLPLSHDEVVHDKGSLVARCPATTGTRRRAYVRCWRSCGRIRASRLLFMGGEFGQDGEWAEARSLDW